jgi:hypothetical protein
MAHARIVRRWATLRLVFEVQARTTSARAQGVNQNESGIRTLHSAPLARS